MMGEKGIKVGGALETYARQWSPVFRRVVLHASVLLSIFKNFDLMSKSKMSKDKMSKMTGNAEFSRSPSDNPLRG
jgi:hypothetical protein